MTYARSLCIPMLFVIINTAHSVELSLTKGSIGIESYYYPEDVETEQKHGNVSVFTQAENYLDINENLYGIITPFARLDSNDSNRNRFDLVDGYLSYNDGPMTLNVGMRKISWSVTESVNLIPHQVIDIINQRDVAGDTSGKDKFGTLMINPVYQSDTLLIEGFVLPYFRERTYPSLEAREHPFQAAFDLTNDGLFTDTDDERRLSWAVRLEAVMASTNVALIHYNGYALQPLFEFNATGTQLNKLYYLVNMTGITVQSSLNKWLFKTETAYFDTGLNPSGFNLPDNYISSVTGVEYTFIRPRETADISVFAEWLYDERDDGLDGVQFQNDLFFGARWQSNDLNSSELVAGIVKDLDESALVTHIEYQSRFNEKFRLNVVLRFFTAGTENPLYAIRKDDFINTKFQYYF